jgi:hypothetical protein
MTLEELKAPVLLPCPFCGGEAEIITRDVEPQGDPWYGSKEEQFPACKTCGCCLFDQHFHEGFCEEDKKNPINAITAWNTRADLVAPLVEALREIASGDCVKAGEFSRDVAREALAQFEKGGADG